ncbi:hypothetical protein B0H13DRAFT_1885842 [Mycena leptocephala]|nr:hypothetical protein B0H13DRAFT_1885842 [Mycena leptocephala]
MSSPKSFRPRMGGAMRRSSSILAISRPTTPTPSSPVEDSRRSSISESQEGRKAATALTPSGAMTPAPVPAAELLPPADPEPHHLPMSRQKSLRSRMGGAMRRTSSILAISRPTTPTPSTPVEDSRRSSISEPQEIPKSATSLTPSGATPPAPVPAAELLTPAEPEPEHLPMSRQKSLRSRLGGAMRRTSSILAISRPTTPTPSTPVEDSRRSSISEPQEIPKSATSLTPSGATPPAPVHTAALLPPAEPVPEPVSEEPTPAPQANGVAHEAIKRLLPIGAQYQQYPSPIATSPARDADVFTEDVNTTPALSALEQVSEIIPAVEQDAPAPPDEAEPAPVHAAEAEEAAEPASAPTEHDTYVPPPPMLHSSNLGAPRRGRPEPCTRRNTPEYPYFDLVRPEVVHDVAMASPANASEAVVADQQAHLALSPFPHAVFPQPPVAPPPPEPEQNPQPAVTRPPPDPEQLMEVILRYLRDFMYVIASVCLVLQTLDL